MMNWKINCIESRKTIVNKKTETMRYKSCFYDNFCFRSKR